MATDGQRRRRRALRARNRVRVGRVQIRNPPRARQQPLSVLSNNWITETYSVVINTLTGTKTDHVWNFKFRDAPSLLAKLQAAGEFRYLSCVCSFSPITADVSDRISLNPYFQGTAQLKNGAEFVNNGRKIRKADNPFSITLQGPSEPVSYHTSKEIEGGLDVYWFDNSGTAPSPKLTTFGLISAKCVYQYKWKQPVLNLHNAT